MANTGCEKDAAATEALFAKNFAGYDYIVTPSGSCTHHVRENLPPCPQTTNVRKKRRSTFELWIFLDDVLEVESRLGGVPAHGRPAQQVRTLRELRTASASEMRVQPLLEAHGAAVRGEGHPLREAQRPTNAAASAARSRSSRNRSPRAWATTR